MPTKTERILSFLPGTFRTAPQAGAGPSVLRSVVDAFGRELLAAENSLATVMRAHWVDHADRGADEIDDLRRLAALYGLAPRPDEGVEEFREHLKRYVRTFLEGTVTVQGVLRVAAEALGLTIADAPEELESWWRRGGDLVTVERRGDDAAERLFGAGAGSEAVVVAGRDARRAAVTGTVDLSDGADLREASTLRLAVDGAPPVDVDLAAGAADPARVTLDEMVAALAASAGGATASHDGRFLTVSSPTAGAASRLEVGRAPGDAASAVLGLTPRVAEGRDAAAARVRGATALPAALDLTEERYLRLLVDGAHAAEIDCAGSDPAATTPGEVAAAIDAAFPFDVASVEGGVLVLTSPTAGPSSSVGFLSPAAQDARLRLFGPVATFHAGTGEEPARFTGAADLSRGLDLSGGSKLRLRIDDDPAVTVDAAGEDPAATTLDEIAGAVNRALGDGVARHDGRFLTLTSRRTGAAARVAVLKLPAGDASDAVFGLRPRTFHGEEDQPARLTGTVDHSGGADLRERRVVRLAVDGAPPVDVDLAAGAADRGAVTLAELAAALDAALGEGTATHDGRFSTVASPTPGGAGRVALLPLTRERRRAFVTRAVVTREAARELFGYVAARAEGRAAEPARVIGSRDLSRGADLSEERFLRLALDGAPAVEVDCAGPRPRATTLEEVVAALNLALPRPAESRPVASSEGGRLVLTSPTAGTESRIAFEPPRALDAVDPLGLVPGTVRGREATGVSFTATVEIPDGVELEAGAAVRMGVDGGPAVEVVLAPDGPATKGLGALAAAVNAALGRPVAGHDGRRLLLASPTRGAESALEIAVPEGPDATAAVLGITPPRLYRGRAAEPARVRGSRDLTGGLAFGRERVLRLAVDGEEARVPLGGAGPTPPEEVVQAVNDAFAEPVAALEEGRLVVTSRTAGTAGRVVLERHLGGDARGRLLGEVPDTVTGRAPEPATLTGEVNLTAPADLSRRRRLRVAVDGGPPFELDAAGPVPGRTFLDEAVAAIDAARPGLASATEEGRLRLTSPTAGPESRVDLLPLRHLEVEEYPPVPAEARAEVRHGGVLEPVNPGAAAAPTAVEIRAPHGTHGPGLANLDAGWSVRLAASLGAGETARLRRGPDGDVQAEIVARNGAVRPLPPESLSVAGEVPLLLLRGGSRWLYLECTADRFDEAAFDAARFAGEPCSAWAVFDVSRFAAEEAGEGEGVALFAPSDPPPDPPVAVALRWRSRAPGAFRVNLPADLPPRFGGRFDEVRFAPSGPELYADAVTEPEDDERHVTRLFDASRFVEAEVVPRPPLGFTAVPMPFRKPRRLTLGDAGEPARLYLAEPGLAGVLEIRAREPGAWGNEIAVAARRAGAARFEMTVHYQGGVFENARRAVRGDPLPSLAEDLLGAGAIGVLQAKAAGVRAEVTRDRAEPPEPEP